MSGHFNAQQTAWWQTLVWALLAAIFAGQTIGYGMAGDNKGWDTSTEGMRRP